MPRATKDNKPIICNRDTWDKKHVKPFVIEKHGLLCPSCKSGHFRPHRGILKCSECGRPSITCFVYFKTKKEAVEYRNAHIWVKLYL